MFSRTLLKIALLAPALTIGASAVPIDLAHPTLPPFTGQALGNNDRGIVFDVLEAFDITSAGIVIDPLAGGVTQLDVFIWEVTGFNPTPPPNNPGTRGPNLATGSAAVVDTGLGFYDVPVLFSFQAGKRYGVSFDPAGAATWGTNINRMEFYEFQYTDTPYDVPAVDPLVTVVAASLAGNLFHLNLPHVRLDTTQVIPEPATGFLLGGALLLIGVGRRFWQR